MMATQQKSGLTFISQYNNIFTCHKHKSKFLKIISKVAVSNNMPHMFTYTRKEKLKQNGWNPNEGCGLFGYRFNHKNPNRKPNPKPICISRPKRKPYIPSPSNNEDQGCMAPDTCGINGGGYCPSCF